MIDKKSGAKNVGAITKIAILPVYKIASFPALVSYRNIYFNEIITVDENSWEEIYFTPETANAGSDGSSDAPGILYKNYVNAEYPAENKNASMLLENLKGIPIIIYVENLNGTKKIFGTPENPMELVYSQDTGSTVMDNTGYSFKFSGTSIFPSIHVFKS